MFRHYIKTRAVRKGAMNGSGHFRIGLYGKKEMVGQQAYSTGTKQVGDAADHHFQNSIVQWR
jgi:hypothetical protein